MVSLVILTSCLRRDGAGEVPVLGAARKQGGVSPWGTPISHFRTDTLIALAVYSWWLTALSRVPL